MIAALILAAAEAMTFTADRIVADNVTHALSASGHIVAGNGPIKIRGEKMTRDAEGRMLFHNPVCATTCTNEVGHTHWGVTGEVEYKEHDYVILRDAWLSFYEIPIFWLPYMYYPLETNTDFRWMAGYTSRWGAYMLTKYNYHILGDSTHDETTYWLRGSTRFDLRAENGVALGEGLKWNLSDFGRGSFKVYYAWDDDYDHDFHNRYSTYASNWESPIDRERYGLGFDHRWNITERDVVHFRASRLSDSSFRRDFVRDGFLMMRNDIRTYQTSGVYWDHTENDWLLGGEFSGRLNTFYSAVGRMPEFYLDVNPQPLFGLPVNYETENRVGYLRRDRSKNRNSERSNPFSYRPGFWADYDTFRADTYHRLTMSYKTLDDLVNVAPRIGYHGTFWDESGYEDLTGWGDREGETADQLYRSIAEAGMTFSGRGYGWIDDKWQHLIEPYADVLLQKAYYANREHGARPYAFDNIDASTIWEDQFAGRGRNLPYTYYGVTPGVRQAWSKQNESGILKQVLDFDVYTALQFNEANYKYAEGVDRYYHQLADVGSPNYGKNSVTCIPGARLRWTPDDDIMFMTRGEYDSDNHRLALADIGFRQKVSKDFDYHINYIHRRYRIWDYSSTPYDSAYMTSDSMNEVNFEIGEAGITYQPFDWFACSPYVCWDCRENELFECGSWFDYLTDCLGFRFIVSYKNDYTYIDGYHNKSDVHYGFLIYLRAIGPNSMDMSRF